MELENFDATELKNVKIDEMSLSEETNASSLSKNQFSCCSTTCSFSTHHYNDAHAAQQSKAMFKLFVLLTFYMIAMVIEIIGGLRANSLAILTDAAHLFSDIIGFSISLFAIRVSRWDSTSRQSYGFNRLEVIGALLSVQLIWLISGALIYEAIIRFISKGSKVNGKLMFIVASFGFLINLLLVIWLGHDHDHSHSHQGHSCEHENSHETEETTKLVSNPQLKTQKNINIQGAYLHLITDLIQSIGVMIGGCVIWVKPNWLFIDLLCTILFVTIGVITTLPMMRNLFYILMERAPNDIDMICLENGLRSIRGVVNVHDVHVWTITVGKNVLSCHVVIGNEGVQGEILSKIREYCQREFKIQHVTVQLEQELQ